MSSESSLVYVNLPDGIHDVLISPFGGLFLTGFDSRRRVCLVIYAPPFGARLQTITQLPYRDYGRNAPTVLAAHDPVRGDLYVLLYQQPDNLGIEQMSLYRVSPASGKETLLSSISSPYWPPSALVPRADGSVLVSLQGLGPLLAFDRCNETSCDPPRTLNSAASNTTGVFFSRTHPFPPYVTPHFPYISQSTYFFEDSLEIWYLLACAALQADETSIALEELKRAIAHGESEACAPSEKGWLTQLVELRGEAEAAAAAQR